MSSKNRSHSFAMVKGSRIFNLAVGNLDSAGAVGGSVGLVGDALAYAVEDVDGNPVVHELATAHELQSVSESLAIMLNDLRETMDQSMVNLTGVDATTLATLEQLKNKIAEEPSMLEALRVSGEEALIAVNARLTQIENSYAGVQNILDQFSTLETLINQINASAVALSSQSTESATMAFKPNTAGYVSSQALLEHVFTHNLDAEVVDVDVWAKDAETDTFFKISVETQEVDKNTVKVSFDSATMVKIAVTKITNIQSNAVQPTPEPVVEPVPVVEDADPSIEQLAEALGFDEVTAFESAPSEAELETSNESSNSEIEFAAEPVDPTTQPSEQAPFQQDSTGVEGVDVNI